MLLENVSVVVVGVVAVDKGTIVDVDRGAIVDEVVDEVTGGMGDVSVVAVVGPFDVEDVDCEVSVDPVAVVVDRGTVVVVVDRGTIVDEVVDVVTGGMGDVSVVAVVGTFDVEEVDCEVTVDPVDGVVTVEGVLDGGAVVDTVVTAVDVSVEVMVVVAEVVTAVVSVDATVAIVVVVGVGMLVVVET